MLEPEFTPAIFPLPRDVLPELLEIIDLSHPWVYLIVFLGVSLLMMWRLEAMLDHGLEGTALGTLIMPYCSGLGNLIFVGLMISRENSAREVLINCLVNNVTNLTLLLGLPALFWGLTVIPRAKGKSHKPMRPGRAATESHLNRLSLLLTLTAVVFFTGAVWTLGRDGVLTRSDGVILIGLFLFWQCIQVFDVLKHNVRQRVTYRPMFYVDLLIVLICAGALYESIDWLVTWLSAQKSGFVSETHLGWLSGWLMVLPNALLALYWGWKRRADVVYTSQVGDGHICIPLCLGIFVLFRPMPLPALFETSMLLLFGVIVVHAVMLLFTGGLPRWAGGVLTIAYGWFIWQGLLA